MAKTNKGPVGPTYSIGVRDRIHLRTLPVPETHPNPIKSRPAKAGVSGDHRNDLKRGGIRDTNPTRGEFFLHPLSSTKKRRRPEACHKSKKTQFFHKCPALQDGGNPHPQKPAQERRLAYKDRLERCLFFNPHKTTTQEVPVLPIRKQSIPLQLPPIRSGLSPMGLYQDPKADSSSRTGAGDTVGGIHRRHSPNGRDQGEGQRPRVWPDTPFSMSRVHNKLGEDNTTTIGFMVDSIKMELSLPAQKMKNIRAESRQLLGAEHVTCRALSRLIGKMNATNQVIPPAPLFYRSLQIDLASALREGNQDYETTLALSPDSKEELIWWDTQMINWNGKALLTMEPDLIIESDASTQGWGASHQGSSTGGPWSSHEREYHINCLELLAATLALKTFAKHMTGISVLMKIDNTTAVAYINNQGGTVSKELISLTRNLWMWCLERNIHIQAQHLPGVLNQAADRSMRDRSDWSLNHSTFQKINRVYGPLEVDLFASRLTNQCQRYFSWRPDPFAEATDAFLQDWTIMKGFANPPWNLVPRVLTKTQAQGADVILIAPVWKTQPWYPLLLSLIVDWPRLLPPPETQYRVSTHNAPISRLEHLREGLSNQGLSGQATDLIINSWRSKTSKSYDSLFSRWNRWCSERGSDPLSGPVSEVANFLGSLYQEGYQYNSVNAYRSAISSVHNRADGVPVGQHPIITRLIKGIFNVRPPIPRYSNTWDVQRVLNFLQSRGKSETLSLKWLTLKSVFLLAITRPSRSADLSQLDTSRMRPAGNGVSFLPSALAKQSRQGKPIETFFFPSFPQNPILCPVETISVYIDQVRGNETKLFLSFIKPHKAVTSSTIARWLRTVLE